MKHLIFLMLLATCTFAQTESATVTLDKSQLPPHLLKQLEEHETMQILEKRINTYGKWVGMGKEVGIAMREGLGALTDEVDKFSDTKVGYFIMGIIAFKVIGYQLMQLIVGIPLILIGTFFFIWILKKQCLPYRYLKQEIGEGKDKRKVYDIQEPGEPSYTSWAVIGYIVWIGICMLVTFAH